jgi:hypothetical protein
VAETLVVLALVAGALSTLAGALLLESRFVSASDALDRATSDVGSPDHLEPNAPPAELAT